jgi:hypothetical protein
MSNRIQACDHSHALYLSVKTLTRQLEELTQQLKELQQLRNRVRTAEAKAVRAWRYQGRIKEKGYRSWRVH